ncbi:amidohydrolase family protein [Streptomyces sp. NPDC001652]|uniref:amidohydrolase family protein n=1 Tax=Streptomyces sp. NPDC001652 TaxID=3154393 RepID=UPI00331B7CE8
MIEFLFDTTRAVINMLFAGTLKRHPRLRVIVPHCGATLPVVADRVDSFLLLFGSDRNSPPNVIAQLRRMYYDTAGFSPLTRQVPALLNLVDPERLLYGSDYCRTPAPVAEIHAAAFADAPPPGDGTTWQSLITTNAHRLLPRLAG